VLALATLGRLVSADILEYEARQSAPAQTQDTPAVFSGDNRLIKLFGKEGAKRLGHIYTAGLVLYLCVG
jgi:hypothetical protein